MVKAGLIRKTTGTGLYALMPDALKVMENLVKIIDDELQDIGCQKVQMPLLLSGDLWKRTGRWETTGKEVSSRENSFLVHVVLLRCLS
jgi:prolyl-tRNA synthetase